jgi:uncharacterized tellurite resistance protein B-like protein
MYSKDVVKSHVKNLIKLAHADGKMAMNEVMFIQLMAHKMGLSKEEFEAITNDLNGVRDASPWDMEKKKELFSQLVTMVSSDLDIHEEELKLIDETGKGMGLPVKSVEDVAEALQNANDVLTVEKIKTILN